MIWFDHFAREFVVPWSPFIIVDKLSHIITHPSCLPMAMPLLGEWEEPIKHLVGLHLPCPILGEVCFVVLMHSGGGVLWAT